MITTRSSIAAMALAAVLPGLLAACDLAAEAEHQGGAHAAPVLVAETDAQAENDIAAQLAAIPGLTFAEQPEQAPPGYRFFTLAYEQPVDHDDPAGPWFSQHMALLHRDAGAPMVFAPSGYELYAPSISEPTAILGANQLSVEHRYFGASRPASMDWQHLNIAQAAADHHRIVEALKPLYDAAWVSTGVSKDGMSALYHRRFYPDDMDGTVAYVSPMSFARKDPRYAAFLYQVGDASCRQRVRELQREALLRRDSLVPMIEQLAQLYGMDFARVGGGAAALDIAVAEFGFQFWQYGQLADCDQLPQVDAGDGDLLSLLSATAFYATDLGVELFLPYYYQAMTELGYPRLPTAHLSDLLVVDPNDYTVYTGELPVPEFDITAMFDMTLWAAFDAESVIYLYGEIDPWTAGAFPAPPRGRRDVHAYLVPGGNHGAQVADLGDSERADVHALLEAWTGVTVQDSVAPAAAPRNPAAAARGTRDPFVSPPRSRM